MSKYLTYLCWTTFDGKVRIRAPAIHRGRVIWRSVELIGFE